MSYGYVPTQLAGPSTAPPVFALALVFTSAPTCTSVRASERFAYTAADSIFSTLPSLSNGFASHTFSDTQTQMGSTTYWQLDSGGTFLADPSSTRGNGVE